MRPIDLGPRQYYWAGDQAFTFIGMAAFTGIRGQLRAFVSTFSSVSQEYTPIGERPDVFTFKFKEDSVISHNRDQIVDFSRAQGDKIATRFDAANLRT